MMHGVQISLTTIAVSYTHLAYKIPTIITTVQNIFLQAWTISAIKEYNSNDRDLFYKRTFFALNAVMSICSVSYTHLL